MGCTSCGSKNGKPNGCKSNGGCSSGSCNRLNTYNWLADVPVANDGKTPIVEVGFKQGARKDFYLDPNFIRPATGEMVVVESSVGHHIGRVSLGGELIKLQLKKKGVEAENVEQKILRLASQNDLDRLHEACNLEHDMMVKARVIARKLNLEMKIGDVELQADQRKAVFFYTAEGRVDFRELIKVFAKEFKVRIEMRQIGARQESARLGGIGSCGRELCCSTWLTNFKSVPTSAARYQNLAINLSKLSGQCGRLKCCLNYELETYIDALEAFPKKADNLKLKKGKAQLIKTDVFKKLMYYSFAEEGIHKTKALSIKAVKKILSLNEKGVFPESLESEHDSKGKSQKEGYFDVTGGIELKPLAKKKRPNKKNFNRKKKKNKSKK